MIFENGRFSQSDDVRSEISRFAEDAQGNLRRLHWRLSRSKFKFPAAKGVPIAKLDERGRPTGKFRPIVLASVESRIVQRAVLNVLLSLPRLTPFVRTPYSFGGLRKERAEGATLNENLSAVPAAIKAALDAIERDAHFCATADITAFFTKISKPAIRSIISEAAEDEDFMAFFDQAIRVELANLVTLREKAAEFPIEEIGVAQGNSLSPLLGNIALAEFDKKMNEGDCTCIRYIDDLLILAPTRKVGNAGLRRATKLLGKLGMSLSPEKTSRGSQPVLDGFQFLGIEICPGLIRPAPKAQHKLLEKVALILGEGKRGLVGLRNGQSLERSKSFLGVLKTLDGTVSGWGKHYWFCNDKRVFQNLDRKIWEELLDYLGCYTEIRAGISDEVKPLALGMAQLRFTDRQPFAYPSAGK